MEKSDFLDKSPKERNTKNDEKSDFLDKSPKERNTKNDGEK
jgi:hypothetical protein